MPCINGLFSFLTASFPWRKNILKRRTKQLFFQFLFNTFFFAFGMNHQILEKQMKFTLKRFIMLKQILYRFIHFGRKRKPTVHLLRFVADPSDVHTALTNFVSTDKAINHGFSGLIPDNDFPVPDKIADKTRATLRDDTTTILSPENDHKTYRQ